MHTGTSPPPLPEMGPASFGKFILFISWIRLSMSLPKEAGPISGRGGGEVPVCIKDYASGENVMEKVDPVFADRKFNPVPVRIIIDKEGKVKHIHFLSAFPDQTKTITDA